MDKLPSSRLVLDAMLREGSVDLLRRQVIESVLREEEDELKRQSRKRAKEVLERFCVGADRPTALREVRRRLAQSKVYLNVGESVERALDQVENVIKKNAADMIEGIAKKAATTSKGTNPDVPKPVIDTRPTVKAEINGSASTAEPDIKIDHKEEEKPSLVKQDPSAFAIRKDTPIEVNKKDVDKHSPRKTALDERVDATGREDVQSSSALEGSSRIQDDWVVLSKEVQDLAAKAEPEQLETPVSGSREKGNSAKEEMLLEEKPQWQAAEECKPKRIQPEQPAEGSLEQEQPSEPEAAAPSKESESGNTAERAGSSTGKRKNATQKWEKDDTRLVAEPQSPNSEPPAKAAGVRNTKPVPEKTDTGGTRKVKNVKNIEAVCPKPAASKRPPRERRRSSKFGGDEWESDLDKLLRPRSTTSVEKSLTAAPAVELNSKNSEKLQKVSNKSKPEDRAEPVGEKLNGKEIKLDDAAKGNEKLNQPKSASKEEVENLAVDAELRGSRTQSATATQSKGCTAPPSQDPPTRELRHRSRSQTKNLPPLAEKDTPTTQLPKVLTEEENARTAQEPGHSAVVVRQDANTTMPTEREQEPAKELKKSNIKAFEKKLEKTLTRERRNVLAKDMNLSDSTVEDNQEKKTDTRELRNARSRDLRTSDRGVAGKDLKASDSAVVENDVKRAPTRELRSTPGKDVSNSERVEYEKQPKTTPSRELRNPHKRNLDVSNDATRERNVRKKTITGPLKAVSKDASDDKLAGPDMEAKKKPSQRPTKASSTKPSHSKVAASEEPRETPSKKKENLDSHAPVMSTRRTPTREAKSTPSKVVVKVELALNSKNVKKAPTREDKKSASEDKETPRTTELRLPTLELGPEARTSSMKEFTLASPTNTSTPQSEPDSAKRRSGRERTVSIKLNDIGYQGKGSKTPKKRILHDKKGVTAPEASLKATPSPPSGTSMSSALKKAGKKLIGIRVKISLPRKELQSDTKRWYFGTIVNYEKLRHVVAFDEDSGDRAGDKESFNLDEEEFALIAKRA
ncbi:hypothetical protein NDN08_000608 [Rhodosorus marinus]|uniref:Uncharacterized protein n=1 Tax=Rhodosorus marinus TaxID=101924 RepID=A0AAV8UNN1_9RHOD|nr:hypothetical protein NDN08_000608 [Rhodosorus marinus]